MITVVEMQGGPIRAPDKKGIYLLLNNAEPVVIREVRFRVNASAKAGPRQIVVSVSDADQNYLATTWAAGTFDANVGAIFTLGGGLPWAVQDGKFWLPLPVSTAVPAQGRLFVHDVADIDLNDQVSMAFAVIDDGT